VFWRMASTESDATAKHIQKFRSIGRQSSLDNREFRRQDTEVVNHRIGMANDACSVDKNEVRSGWTHIEK